MQSVVTDAVWSVCVSLYLSVTAMSCTKTSEPVEMLVGLLTRVCPKNHVLDGGMDPPGNKQPILGAFPVPL